MSSIKQKLHKEKQKYLNISIEKNNKQKSFCKQLSVLNKNTGEVNSLDYDFNKIQQDNYLWIVFNSIYLQNEMEKRGDKVAYFITQTLPTEYHPYHTHDRKGKKLKNFLYNKKYSENNTISQGYKKLNTAFRSLIKDWKVETDIYDRLYFQKVLEPHKSFQAHLHGLVYVDSDKAEDFEKYFWKKNKANGLGRADLTRIKDIKRSAVYLTKYISKSIKPEPTNGITDCITNGDSFDGWKKYNKINVYTYSRIAIPRYIFKKVSNVLRLKVENGENILELIESLIDIHIDIHYDNEIINTKITPNDNSRYSIKIDKEKVIRKDIQFEYDLLLSPVLRLNYLKQICRMYDTTTVDMWSKTRAYLYDIEELETIYDWWDISDTDKYHYLYEYLNNQIEETTVISYRIKTFTIYDKKYDKIIYDKNDYELL